MRYIVDTEKQDILGTENWHTEITDAKEGTPLSGADGDNEVESIALAFCFLLGNLPADFPPTVIGEK